MAIDWLKIEINTPDKPEIFALAVRMKWSDLDLVVGKLIRLWRWFDQHTLTGYAPGVTDFMLDQICNAPGFSQALVEVGWLELTAEGATLPHFDVHNGKTAKQRALSARRMNELRGRRNGSDDASVTNSHNRDDASVISSSPEEVKNKTLSIEEPVSQNQSQNQKRKSKFAKPTIDEVRREVESRGSQVDPVKFWHFYEAKGWKVGNQPMKNWKSAIVTWEKREPKPRGAGSLSTRGYDELMKTKERLGK